MRSQVLLLLTLACSASALAENTYPIFSVRDYTQSGITYSGAGEKIRYLIEPLAYVKDGKLINLPEDIDQTKFEREHYQPNKRYRLYAGGNNAGTVSIVGSAFDIQCESLAAVVSVKPSGLIRGMKMGLASNGELKTLAYSRRAANPEEQEIALQIAARIYADNKVRASVAKRARVRNVVVFDGSPSNLMIGSFSASQLRKEQGYDLATIHAAFFIAEKSQDGSYSQVLTWFHTGEEASIQTQDLVDIIDIDGDGVPEIVTQFGYYEAVEYHIYRKSDGAWKEFYKNFGAGC